MGTPNELFWFVANAATPGDAFIKPADWIAVFDNDGTLWVERPLPVQLDFIFRALTKAARRDSTLAEQQPYKAILTQNRSFFEAVGEQHPDAVRALEQGLSWTGQGTTPDEFEAEVMKYLSDMKSERFGVPYAELIYKPMLEVFELLAANDFDLRMFRRRPRIHAGDS